MPKTESMRFSREIWNLLKFWLNALWDSFSAGWVVIGVLSLVNWIVQPIIVKLDTNPSTMPYQAWWDWLKFNAHWWETTMPLFVVILLYLIWAPYTYCRTLKLSLTSHEERAKAKFDFIFSKDVVGCFSPDDQKKGWYLRLGVKNVSTMDVTGCYGVFIGIEKNGVNYDQENRRL